jgi:hypothetical protein
VEGSFEPWSIWVFVRTIKVRDLAMNGSQQKKGPAKSAETIVLIQLNQYPVSNWHHRSRFCTSRHNFLRAIAVTSPSPSAPQTIGKLYIAPLWYICLAQNDMAALILDFFWSYSKSSSLAPFQYSSIHIWCFRLYMDRGMINLWMCITGSNIVNFSYLLVIFCLMEIYSFNIILIIKWCRA